MLFFTSDAFLFNDRFILHISIQLQSCHFIIFQHAKLKIAYLLLVKPIFLFFLIAASTMRCFFFIFVVRQLRYSMTYLVIAFDCIPHLNYFGVIFFKFITLWLLIFDFRSILKALQVFHFLARSFHYGLQLIFILSKLVFIYFWT